MTIRDRVYTSAAGLAANRLRATLTILGVGIGVSAVIFVLAMSRGASDLIVQQVQGIGSQTVIVRAGQDPRGPSSFSELFSDSLKAPELKSLRDPARVSHLRTLAPIVTGAAALAARGETTRATFVGTAPAFFDIFGLPAPDGRLLSEEDVRARADVAVLGSTLKDALFGPSDAVGTTVRLKNRSLRVIGAFPPVGQAGIFDIDRTVFVPYTTAQQTLLGTRHFNAIILQAQSEKNVPTVAQDARRTLRELHDITDPEKDDFFVASQADLLRIIGNITAVLTALLVALATISLVVGGVGIMNVMLVSVTERTREIGLRKAVGATTRDILAQFLLEAVLLTSIGGFSGLALGIALSLLAAVFLRSLLEIPWSLRVPWSGVVLGLGVATATGLIFGLYPALRAARKSPLEALRHE